FEQAVALSLHLWPALTLAVQNNWSDNTGEDVRDWFAGAVVELFPSFLEEPYPEDVEARLLQIMEDEFSVNVDDDSSYETAEQILRLRANCTKGDFEEVEQLREKWLSRKGKKVSMQQAPDPDQDTDWESDDDEDDDGDVDMDEAPALVSVPKEKPPPEVDEDGFTKVTRKKR
ncbi:Pre-rRNA-processing protein TSR2-domain-containing protein, partial [Xylariales sp. PMI_506]